MPKDILTWIDPEARSEFCTAYAQSIAKLRGGHVTGAVFAVEPDVAFYEGAFPEGALAMIRQRATDAAREAADAFSAAARDREVNADRLILTGSPAQIEEQFAELARHFDVTVLPQPERDGSAHRRVTIEAALFGSGRPVIIVPYIWKPPARLSRILVAWDRGVSATRTLAAATPLLAAAEWVEVVTVTAEREEEEAIPGFDIGRHLARHGIAATTRRIASEISAGDALLSHASDANADLLVMGGYGHSRLRETLLGGATRTVLETMTLPTFMAH